MAEHKRTGKKKKRGASRKGGGARRPRPENRRRDRVREEKRSRGPAPGGMTAVEFWSLCSMNGLIIDDPKMEKLSRYVSDLLYWNEKINLISRRDTEHVWRSHILHSLTPILLGMIPKSGRVLDIGSGGGLPGIPMKIVHPALDIVLLDSIAKKVKTTEMLASHVIDHGLKAFRERAEEMPNYPEYAEGFDLVIARAVAPLVDLIGWAKPLLKPGSGRMVLLKGGTLVDELDHAVGKHPDAQVTIHEIKLTGTDWFADEQKRIVTVHFGGASTETQSGETVALPETVPTVPPADEPAEGVTVVEEGLDTGIEGEASIVPEESGLVATVVDDDAVGVALTGGDDAGLVDTVVDRDDV